MRMVTLDGAHILSHQFCVSYCIKAAVDYSSKDFKPCSQMQIQGRACNIQLNKK